MKTLILILTAASLSIAAEADSKQLQAKARAANSPTAHSEVSRDYLDRAAALDAKASRHEAEAERMAKDTNYNPMNHKWPALAAAPAERERRLAMQARRAANEARELAQKHEKLATVKGLAAE